jgi:hypothetical protein
MANEASTVESGGNGQVSWELSDDAPRLSASAARAKALVDESRKATLSLLKPFFSADPQAAAMKQLIGMVRSELQKVLAPLLDPLLQGVPAALQPTLRSRFTSALLGGFGS